MTGCMLVADDFCLVITEGSLKSQKKYSRLMLNRIDWNQGQEDEQQGTPLLRLITQGYCINRLGLQSNSPTINPMQQFLHALHDLDAAYNPLTL